MTYYSQPDWANGFLYTVLSSSSIVRISTDLQTVTPVGPPSVGYIASIAVANGHVYFTASGTHDVFVTKLDPSGNVIYSTYFGGGSDDFCIRPRRGPCGKRLRDWKH